MGSPTMELMTSDQAGRLTHPWGWLFFERNEIECPCCKQIRVAVKALDALDQIRLMIQQPIIVNSAYRCPSHNRAVHGSPTSEHMDGVAFDLSIQNLDRWVLLGLARQHGATAFGYYRTFIHVAWSPRPRSWVGSSKARAVWRPF